MKIKLEQLSSTKYFHVYVILFMVFVILFITGIITLKYSVEGESSLPFDLSKISIISIVEGTDMEDGTNRWNLQVSQNNDIYLYIKKNDNYENTETINKITLENFQVKEQPKIGVLKLYKPDSQMENKLFKNILFVAV